jgi:hypothetical protein
VGPPGFETDRQEENPCETEEFEGAEGGWRQAGDKAEAACEALANTAQLLGKRVFADWIATDPLMNRPGSPNDLRCSDFF